MVVARSNCSRTTVELMSNRGWNHRVASQVFDFCVAGGELTDLLEMRLFLKSNKNIFSSVTCVLHFDCHICICILCSMDWWFRCVVYCDFIRPFLSVCPSVALRGMDPERIAIETLLFWRKYNPSRVWLELFR